MKFAIWYSVCMIEMTESWVIVIMSEIILFISYVFVQIHLGFG